MQSQIGLLKIRGAGKDRLRLRLGLDRLLGSAEWRPAGMPPTAVLMVRHLYDPLPGQLASHMGAVRVKRQWETAVQAQVADLYRRAARPEKGHVSASAAAVLFADEAEMLACLALDIYHHVAGQRWWWQALLRARASLYSNSLAALFGSQPHLAPAIFNYLAGWNQAIPVVQALSATQAAAVLAAITQAYELPDPSRLTSDRQPEAPTLPPGQPATVVRRETDATPSLPPWEAWLPAALVPQHLGREQADLLGVSLVLHRRPALARSPTFSRELRAWWQNPAAPAASEEQPALVVDATPNTSVAPPAALIAISSKWTEDERLAGAASRKRAAEMAVARPVADETPGRPVAGEPAGLPFPAGEPGNPAARSQPGAPEEREATDALPGAGYTRLGGLLYLVNLMERLDLPACFEETWHLASQVGAWGALELLGRALLGLERADFALAGDPIWTALAELDGRRPGELPGAAFDGPVGDQLPAAWLVMAAGQPLPPARPLSRSPWLRPVHPRPRRWLALAMPFICWRLRQALPAAEALAQAVLLVGGRLYVTATHVDLVFRLKDVSLPIRLAGLDFDPGWAPAFGRVIQFHFES
ncbi:MAG: hypothetical protein L0332_20200 [Chloroflexi bacterium]|nr:hypothetical protein [Chloroflexota bacterium]MCI0577002.1 hypothetical protein [Chloroflexota bacterium]MCI0647777.1 hypothetical protein [Chloroflexota bacterium]MCI0729021.1 hypothetical protein [Chloroflexota bacterium]